MEAGNVNASGHSELEGVVREAGGACLIAVRATPRASSTGILGVADGRLRIRLQAPPVEGAANEALEGWLAKTCGVSRSSVRVERGMTGREKTVRLSGVPRAVVLRHLAEALSGDPKRSNP